MCRSTIFPTRSGDNKRSRSPIDDLGIHDRPRMNDRRGKGDLVIQAQLRTKPKPRPPLTINTELHHHGATLTAKLQSGSTTVQFKSVNQTKFTTSTTSSVSPPPQQSVPAEFLIDCFNRRGPIRNSIFFISCLRISTLMKTST